MPVTIRELSKHLGLSMSTVSKALNGYPDVSPATREAVNRAARELGYWPNAHARALKTGQSYNIGVLFVDDSNSGLTHPFFSGVLEAFKKEAEAKGYDITFISHDIGDGRGTYLEHCLWRDVDGVCIAAVDFDDPQIGELTGSDLPLVTIDSPCRQRTCVQSDNLGGMSALVEYAIACGHRRLAFIHGPASATTNSRRLAFEKQAARYGLAPDAVVERQCLYNEPDSLEEVFRSLLNEPEPPTCVLCSDDMAAMGAYRAAAELGLSIPGDISIAGFDGVSYLQWMTPRLTTVRQRSGEIGATAARLLLQEIGGQPPAPQPVCIPCELIRGETMARIG